jgi:hypothetical protein
MGTIIGWLVMRGLSPGVARGIAYVLGTLAALAVLGGLIAAYNAHVIHGYEQKQTVRAAPATDRAATERAHDAEVVTQTEKENNDAIHSVPDQVPTGPSHALACKRLRDHHISSPACQ